MTDGIATGEAPHVAFGTLVRHVGFPSRWVAARNVDIWVPPGHGEGDRRFPVLYMHDGQNVFDPKTSFIGVDWGVVEAVERLVAQGRVPGALLVGVWNTPERMREYAPQRPLGTSKWPPRALRPLVGGPPLSDGYLRFLVEELKPYVDTRYQTLPGRDNTSIMGSSMGGLISLYALCEYPGVFGGAACLSTAWPVVGQPMLAYLKARLPEPGAHRIYFDRGTEEMDATYARAQRQVDRAMAAAGYREGWDWQTQVFQGADHSERAWRARVHIPLEFLLTPRSVRAAPRA